MRRFLLHLPPSDRIVMGLLLLAVLVAGAAWPARGRIMVEYVVLHLVLLAAFAALAFFLMRHERWTAVQFLRPLATVAVIFTLYTSLGKLGVARGSKATLLSPDPSRHHAIGRLVGHAPFGSRRIGRESIHSVAVHRAGGDFVRVGRSRRRRPFTTRDPVG